MSSVPLIKTVSRLTQSCNLFGFLDSIFALSAFDPQKQRRRRSQHGSLTNPFFNTLSHPANEDLHLTVEEWMEEIRIRHMPLASNEVLHAEEIRGRCGEIARQSREMAKKVCKLGLHIMKHYYYQISPRFSHPLWQKERKKQQRVTAKERFLRAI